MSIFDKHPLPWKWNMRIPRMAREPSAYMANSLDDAKGSSVLQAELECISYERYEEFIEGDPELFAFVAKAVNLHAELLAACEAGRDAIHGIKHRLEPSELAAMEQMQSVLARAREVSDGA